MEFIEMTGKQLFSVIHPEELDAEKLRASGVEDESIIRVNRQGDIEIRRHHGWEILGGLLGDFQQRITHETGFEWVPPSAAQDE